MKRTLGVIGLAAAVALALVGAAWLGGFFGSGSRSERDGPRPAQARFTGRWALDPSSLESVRSRTGTVPAESYLQLGVDGRFSAVGMPVESSFMSPPYQLLSGAGDWEIVLKQAWCVVLRFPGKGSPMLYIDFEGDEPRALWWPVGDPDSAERWVWRKAP